MRRLELHVIIILLITVLLIEMFATSLYAQTDIEDITRSYEGLIWAPGGDGGCSVGNFGTTSLPSSVPEPYNSIFSEAATEYGIDVVIMATIFYTENRGFPDPPPPYGGGGSWPVSGGGAKGPFQFLDGTWSGFGVDGDGDGDKDVNDLIDASYGAANYIKSLNGTTGLPLGALEDEHFQYRDSEDGAVKTVARVFKSYNAGPATWRNPSNSLWMEGSRGAWITRKQNEINDYIIISTEKYVDIATNGVIDDTANLCATVPGGSIGVSPDGFVFPLLVTRQQIIDGVDGAVWCYRSLTSCHHNYNAADIFVETGTVVIAAKPGRVVRVVPNESTGVGSRVVIVGTEDPDTPEQDEAITYYYTHMGPGTINLQVGDIVDKAGRIGEVGTNAQSVGTTRHLHFDMLPPPYDYRPSCSAAACKAYPFIDVQPFLVPAFERLAEG